jgi:hypothetical protein
LLFTSPQVYTLEGAGSRGFQILAYYAVTSWARLPGKHLAHKSEHNYNIVWTRRAIGKIVVVVVSADTLAAPHEMTAIRIQAHSGTLWHESGSARRFRHRNKHVRVVTASV